MYIKFCFKNFIHGVTKLLFEYNGRAKLNSTFGLFFACMVVSIKGI